MSLVTDEEGSVPIYIEYKESNPHCTMSISKKRWAFISKLVKSNKKSTFTMIMMFMIVIIYLILAR